MFKLNDGRSYFWQWDINQKLVTTELPIGTEVHFYHEKKIAAKSVVEQEGNKRVCKVPNKLLEVAGTIEVYGYVVENPNARNATANSTGNRTVGRKKFMVKPRPEPVK